MPEIELFTASRSPFAQRVHLALLEKGIDFWRTEVDLANKPEWFLVISPMGEVPVIRHEDRFITDSTVILEYLEDVYPTPALRPKDAALRAVTRFWIEYADERLVPAMRRAAKSLRKEGTAASAELRDRLIFIEREGLARCGRGPYWLGQELGLLDIVFYPLFERLPAILHDQPAGLSALSIRLRYWLDAMRDRASVRATQRPVELHANALGAKPDSQRRRVGNVEYLHA
ncbi:MAG TPA: glutathione S-transferase family protein [Alphaproteobacteria bacterium]|nr:glutathione S-transferase family protein [Alphaproteobacteria bacterium]